MRDGERLEDRHLGAEPGDRALDLLARALLALLERLHRGRDGACDRALVDDGFSTTR
jgi:hypothetical protein